MKRSTTLLLKPFQRLAIPGLLAMMPAVALSQQIRTNDGNGVFVGETLTLNTVEPAAAQSPEKPFDLEFPGGAVQAFVVAVEKATGAPFNSRSTIGSRSVMASSGRGKGSMRIVTG